MTSHQRVKSLHSKFKKKYFTSSVKDNIPFKPHLGFERGVKRELIAVVFCI